MHMSSLNHSRKTFNTGNVVVQSCIYNINGLWCAHSTYKAKHRYLFEINGYVFKNSMSMIPENNFSWSVH